MKGWSHGTHFLLSNNPCGWNHMVLNLLGEVFVDAKFLKGVDAFVNAAGLVGKGYSGHIMIGRYMVIEIVG
jgi:hypothetical protein